MNFADLNKDSDYVEILKYFYQKRVHNNRKYSLRSYARDLGITSSRLSQILQKKYGLSKKAGEEISEKLKLNKFEKEVFCNLISIKHSRSKKEKAKASEFFKNFGSYYVYLNDAAFKVVSDWQYYAVMEMSHLLGSNYALETVAQRLGIKMSKAREVTEALLQLGYLKKVSATEMVKSAEYYIGGQVQQKNAALNYTLQIADKLQTYLNNNDEPDHAYTSAFLAMDEKSLAYAKKELIDFCTNLNKEIETRQKKNNPKLYYFNSYIFSAETPAKKSTK